MYDYNNKYYLYNITSYTNIKPAVVDISVTVLEVIVSVPAVVEWNNTNR